jgi:gliding motility-associated-like protein
VTDEIFVDVVIFPPLDLGPDQDICEGETVILDATYTGTWNTGDTGSTLEVGTTGWYVFTLSQSGCSSSDSAFVEVWTIPENILPSQINLCEGEEVVLDAGQAGLWSTGENSASISVDTPGYYDVILTNGPCQALYGTQVDMILQPVVDLGADIDQCYGEPVWLDAAADQNTQYLWNTGDTVSVILADTAGFYTVIASNSCGSVSDTVEVRLEWCGWGLFVPMAFTNNGDGINDSWQVKGYNLAAVKIRVFNRLGDLIFYSEDPTDAWQPDPYTVGDDAYNYHIQAWHLSGEMKEYIGHVIMLR